MEEKKKDWLPIIIYIAIFFGLQIIIGILYGYLTATGSNISEGQILSLTNIIIYMVIGLTFIILYHKRLINDCKRFTKRDIVITIISLIVLLAINFGLTALMLKLNVEMANQDMAISLLDHYKRFMVIALVLCGPIAEEIVYRYSLGTLIKNETTFVIVSSVIFGAIHGLGIITILYALMGAVLALCYLKTDRNIVSSMLIHIINNAIGIIMAISIIG